MTTTLLVTLSFGQGMPIMYLIASLNLFVQYWFNKTLLKKYYAEGRPYSKNLEIVSVQFLLLGIFLNMAFGVWVFSGSGTLETEEVFENDLSLGS